MTYGLAGRHAVVTGGSRGIGASVAEVLLAHGMRVTIMGRNAQALKAQVQVLKERGGDGLGGSPELTTLFGGAPQAVPTTPYDVNSVVCDVGDEASVKDAFGEAVKRLGPVSVLVNNAGYAKTAPFMETTREVWDTTMAVNLTGAYLCAQQVLPQMLDTRFGRIINIASTAALKGYKRMVAYTASKHGLLGLTRALALETAKHGITVNAVCPSYTETDMAEGAIANLMHGLQKTREEALAMLTNSIPTGRLAKPEEVAETVAWLCSPAAAAITGASIPVAGGEVM